LPLVSLLPHGMGPLSPSHLFLFIPAVIFFFSPPSVQPRSGLVPLRPRMSLSYCVYTIQNIFPPLFRNRYDPLFPRGRIESVERGFSLLSLFPPSGPLPPPLRSLSRDPSFSARLFFSQETFAAAVLWFFADLFPRICLDRPISSFRAGSKLFPPRVF